MKKKDWTCPAIISIVLLLIFLINPYNTIHLESYSLKELERSNGNRGVDFSNWSDAVAIISDKTQNDHALLSPHDEELKLYWTRTEDTNSDGKIDWLDTSDLWQIEISNELVPGNKNQLTEDISDDLYISIGNHPGNGKIYAAWTSYRSGNMEIWGSLLEESPSELTGQEPITNHTGSDICPNLSVGDEEIILTWSSDRNGDYDIWLSRMGKNGDWSDPQMVADTGEDDLDPVLVRGAGDEWLLYWNNEDSQNDIAIFRSSSDDLSSFSSPVKIPTKNQGKHPFIVQDQNDLFWMTWIKETQGNMSVQVANSTDCINWNSIRSIYSSEILSEPCLCEYESRLFSAWTVYGSGMGNIYGASIDIPIAEPEIPDDPSQDNGTGDDDANNTEPHNGTNDNNDDVKPDPKPDDDTSNDDDSTENDDTDADNDQNLDDDSNQQDSDNDDTGKQNPIQRDNNDGSESSFLMDNMKIIIILILALLLGLANIFIFFRIYKRRKEAREAEFIDELEWDM